MSQTPNADKLLSDIQDKFATIEQKEKTEDLFFKIMIPLTFSAGIIGIMALLLL
jgi:hypothetical protein